MEALRVGQLAGLDHTFSEITEDTLDESGFESEWKKISNEEAMTMKQRERAMEGGPGEGRSNMSDAEQSLKDFINQKNEQFAKMIQKNPNMFRPVSRFEVTGQRMLEGLKNGEIDEAGANKKMREESRMIEKRDRFERLVPIRVRNAEDALRKVRNLANSSNYEYTDKQAKKIISHLRQEFNLMKTSFQGGKKKNKGFEL